MEIRQVPALPDAHHQEEAINWDGSLSAAELNQLWWSANWFRLVLLVVGAVVLGYAAIAFIMNGDEDPSDDPAAERDELSNS
jgi:hypothetical protein